MNNPFLGLYEVMKESSKGDPYFFIAKVVSPLPTLKVQLNDIVIDKEDLLIDKWLLDRNEILFTKTEGHTHGGDTTGNGEHKHEIKEPIHNKLSINDKVVLLRINDKFIIISKVVNI